jgi:hypothetical protein
MRAPAIFPLIVFLATTAVAHSASATDIPQSASIYDVFPPNLPVDTPAEVTVSVIGTFRGCIPPSNCPLAVKIDNSPVSARYGSFLSTSGADIIVTVPAHPRGTSTLVVTDTAGHSATTTLHYLGTNLLDEYEQVLVPITSTDLIGANGSHWVTETWVENTRPTEATDLKGPFLSPNVSPPGATSLHISPGLAMQLPAPQLVAPAVVREGALLGVPRWLGRGLAFNSRAQDISRQVQTRGTEIPVVRENEFADSITLLNVPGDPRYRILLRVYTRTSAADVRVRVEHLSAVNFFTPPPIFGPPVDTVIHLDAPFANGVGAVSSFGVPGYAQMSIGNYAYPLQVTVTSQSGAPNNLWAFLSITNDETQEVTTITPR